MTHAIERAFNAKMPSTATSAVYKQDARTEAAYVHTMSNQHSVASACGPIKGMTRAVLPVC